MQNKTNSRIWRSSLSAIYLITMCIVTIRFGGYSNMGRLALALFYGGQFYPITFALTRVIQLKTESDRADQSSGLPAPVLAFLCVLGLVAAIIVLLQFHSMMVLCCLLMLLYKVMEAVSRLIYRIYSENGMLKEVVLSSLIKAVVSLLAYSLGLILFDLMVALIFMSLSVACIIIFYDLVALNHHTDVMGSEILGPRLINSNLRMPLCIFCSVCVCFLGSFAVGRIYGFEVLGAYFCSTLLFSAANPCFSALFGGYTGKINTLYVHGMDNQLRKLILVKVLEILGATILLTILAWFLQNSGMTWLFGAEIASCIYLLVPSTMMIFLAGLCCFFSIVIYSIGKARWILTGDVCVCAVCLITMQPLVTLFGIAGTIFSMTISLLIATLVLAITMVALLRHKNEQPLLDESLSAQESGRDEKYEENREW